MDSTAKGTGNRYCEICGSWLTWEEERYYDYTRRKRTDNYLRCPTHGRRPDSAKRIGSIHAETAAATRSHNHWNPRPYESSPSSGLFQDSFTHRVGVLLILALPVAGFIASMRLAAGLVSNGLLLLLVASTGAFAALLGAVGIYVLLERPTRRRWDESERRRVEANELNRAKRRELGQRSYSGLTKSRWTDLLREFEHRCAYCSVLLVPSQTHRDHFVPIARGGADDVSNIVPACAECNRAKRDKMPKAWLAQCRREGRIVNPLLRNWQKGDTATD